MPGAEEIHPPFFSLLGRDEKYANTNEQGKPKMKEVAHFGAPFPHGRVLATSTSWWDCSHQC